MGYLILFGWLVLLPIVVGAIFCTDARIGIGQWVWGQFVLWAVFQVISVIYILKEQRLEELLVVYVAAALLLGMVGSVSMLCRCRYRKHKFIQKGQTWSAAYKMLAGVFVLLYLLQMFLVVRLAVNDGDDAFYMAVANQAQSSGIMYLLNAYSFGSTTLNYRYALAPFPIWIAFLSRISNIHVLVIGHIILGMLLITLSYVIYAQIGRILFGDVHKKSLGLLILIELLYIWGNTSSHTAESFLMLRSRQGKALVAALVFPAMFCILFRIGRALEQKSKLMWQDYVLAAAVILTGFLGSTLGGSLVILLWQSAVFLLAVGYRKWVLLPVSVLCSLPGLAYAALYILNR